MTRIAARRGAGGARLGDHRVDRKETHEDPPVGAGGVGAAFAAIAARRDFFEQIVIADYDPARAEKAAAQDDRYVAAQVDASAPESVAALCREHGITHVMNAVDPRLQHADLRRRVRGRCGLPRHGDVAVEAAPRGAVREDRASSSATSSSRSPTSGSPPGGSPWSGSASSPGSPTCSRGTPPTTCSARSTSSAPATAPTWWSPTTTATRSSRRRSRCGPRSRSASTRR